MSVIDGYVRIKSRSENLIWLSICFRRCKQLILGVVYVPPQNSSYNREDTWGILEEELTSIKEKYSNAEYVLLGDFNAYTGIALEVPGVLIPDLGDVAPLSSRMPRRNKDEKRKINVWGRKLLALCGEHGLMIGNGRFGKDKCDGDFTCLSGPTPSVVDYALIGTHFAPDSVGVEILDLVGSDHRALKLEIKLRLYQKSHFRVSEYCDSDKNVREESLGSRIRCNLSDDDIRSLEKVFLAMDVSTKCLSIAEDQNDVCEIISGLNDLICSCAERCNLTKKEKKAESFFDLECKIMKEKLRQSLSHLKQCVIVEEQKLSLVEYKDLRREYKRLIKRKKNIFENKKKLGIIDCFRKKEYKKFWGDVKKEERNGKANNFAAPEVDSWPDYLEELEGQSSEMQEMTGSTEEAVYPMKENDYDLIAQVSKEEVEKVLKKLKGGSAAGVDGIPVLIFKKFSSVFMPIIVLLCNKVLKAGEWPVHWKKSMFLPLFKKGDPKVHENYRLIALVPALSKLMEKILDFRLATWLNKSSIIHEEQGGFRAGYGTVDRVFVLKALVEKYGKGKNSLYVGFLDLHKAFDSLDRELLKDVLFRIGLPNSFVSIIVSMYVCVKGIVQVGSSVSRQFSIKRGVKQGSTLSPRLFNIFINDIVDFLEKRWAPTISLGITKLSVLLFADDLAVVAKSPEDLQTLLNLIGEYLEMKKLKLNVKKSEVIIVKKRKMNGLENCKFSFNNEELNVVKRIKYLGFVLTDNGSFKSHIDEVINRGKAAMSAIFRNVTIMGIKNLKMHKRIFNTKVLPILEYGAEIWGGEAAKQLESLQLQYYKRVFGLHQTTHSQVLKGDIGLFSLKLRRSILMLRLWLKIIKLSKDRLARLAYDEMLKNGLKHSWPFQIKLLLERVGMPYIWNEGLGCVDLPKDLERQIRVVLEGQEIQCWQSIVSSSLTLSHYQVVKVCFGEEVYFKFNLPGKALSRWIQLRANCLPIQSRQKVFERGSVVPDGRYSCPMCEEEEENLDHFLRRCPKLSDLRNSYLDGVILSLPEILSNINPTVITRVGVYIDKCLELRRSV